MPDLDYLDKYLTPAAPQAQPMDYLDKFIPAPAPSVLSETLKAPARVVGGIAQEAGEAAQYVTGDRLGTGARQWGEGVQAANAQSPAFREAHPILSTAGDVAEGVAKMAPYLAADLAISTLGASPEAGIPLAMGTLARGARLVKAAPFATTVLPAVAGLAQGERSYEKGVQNGLTPDQALDASYAPAAVTGVGMSAMGAMSHGLQSVGGAAKSLTGQFVKHAAADTGIMMGQGVVTSEAEKLTGIDPNAKPLDQLKDPKAWLNAALTGGLFAGIGVAKKGLVAQALKAHLDTIPPEEAPAAVAALAAEIHPKDPAKQIDFAADALDKMQAGEPVISEEVVTKLTAEKPTETRDSILESLAESVDSGGEKNVLEVHEAKEDASVVEALRDEAPKSEEPPAEQAPPVDVVQARADRWVKGEGTVTKSGAVPDAEVAARLDDMGYTLVDKGIAKDGKSRREWEVEKKAEEVPPASREAAVAAYRASDHLEGQISHYLGEGKAKELSDRLENQLSENEGPARQESAGSGGRGEVFYTEKQKLLQAELDKLMQQAANPDSILNRQMENKRKAENQRLVDAMNLMDKTEATELATTLENKNVTPEQLNKLMTATDSGDKEAILDVMHDIVATSSDKLSPTGRASEPMAKPAKYSKGTEVTHEGQPAKVVGNAFGKVKLRFADGTEKSVAKDEINAPPKAVKPLVEGKPLQLSDREAVALKDGEVILGSKNADGSWSHTAFAAKTKEGHYEVDASRSESPEASARLVGVLRELGMGPEAKLNRAEGRGVPADEIRAHLKDIIAKLKVPVEIVNDASEVPGLHPEAPKFNGAFHQGKIYLNSEHITSLAEAEHVLLKHELAHAGLLGSLGRDGLNTVLAKAWGDLKSGVREFAKEKGIDTTSKAGKLEATEEFLVHLAESGAEHPLWDKFVATLKKALRAMGFEMKYSERELRSLVVEATKSMVKPEGGETRFSAAWHGGPHDFDKFSSEHIGNGEGAQAYGHGLYFAGSRKVAEWYKEKLSKTSYTYKGRTFEGDDWSSVEKQVKADFKLSDSDTETIYNLLGDGSTNAKAHVERFISEYKSELAAATTEFRRQMAQSQTTRFEHLAKVLDSIKEDNGKLYQVELAPKESEYLDWDKPVSESPAAKDALTKIREALGNENVEEYEYKLNADMDEWTGRELYRALQDFASEGPLPGDTTDGGNPKAEASAYLHSLGIRGIRYLDGSSRGAGEGNSNYVIFNDEDVSIVAKFNRVAEKADPKDVNEVSSRLSAATIRRALSDSAGNVFRAIMPIDKTIKMAASMPEYAPIKEHLETYYKLKAAKEAAGTAPSIEARHTTDDFANLIKTPEALKAYNDVTHKATLYELHANGKDAGWTETSWKRAGKIKQTGLELGAAQAEVKKLWDSLTPEQQAVQQRAVAHMKELRDESITAQIEPFRSIFPAIFEQANRLSDGLYKELWKAEQMGGSAGRGERRAELATTHGQDVMELAEQMAHIKSEGQLRGDYAPLMRFGDHKVEVFEKTAGGEGKRLEARHFEAKHEALAFDKEMRQDPTKTTRYTLLTEGQRSVVNIPMEFLNKMRASLDAQGITGDQQTKLMQEFESARVATMPRNSLAGNKLTREGVAGYEDSAVKSYSAYVQRSSQLIANLKYGTRIEQTFRDMDNSIKAYDSGEERQPANVERMSSLKDMLYTQEKQLGSERINAATKAIGKSTFLWYLSSPSVWAVQWSQPFITTIPKMAARYGFGRSFAEYVKAAKEFTFGNYSDKKIDAFDRANDGIGKKIFNMIEQHREGTLAEQRAFSAEMKSIYDKFTPAEQKLLVLKVLSHQGAIDLSAAHSLHDLINSTDAANKGIDWLVEKGGTFMRASETGSRRAAAVSAFQMALAEGKDFMKANDYASNIIDDTLFNFSSQNRAALLKGNVGRVVGQFQFFRFHMLGKTIQLAKDAMDGQGAENKAQSRKELAYMMGTSMALSGAAGTPLAMLASNTVTNALWDAAAFLFGDPDDPWNPQQDFENALKESVGETAGNTFLKGLPYLMGMDISKRVGLGGMADMIQGEVPPGASPTDKANWYAAKILGPSWGLVTDGMKTLDAIGNGDYGTAAQAGSPKVLRDFMKAYGLEEDGVRGSGGRTVLQAEDISPFSIALQMVGINPADVSLAQGEARDLANLSTVLKQRRNLLTKRVTDATLAGDMDAREEALEAINAWGAKQPALKVTTSELANAVKRGMMLKAGTLSKKDALLEEEMKGGAE